MPGLRGISRRDRRAGLGRRPPATNVQLRGRRHKHGGQDGMPARIFAVEQGKEKISVHTRPSGERDGSPGGRRFYATEGLSLN